ncbi:MULTISPECIES: YqaA family protein [unclassified Undibacterium]|uniref:YqaA family protein n=1 Tax=unclassified Undibacterium TaxID=2630295 RepID=UPI002AC94A27|nr:MULTISPECIES: YqaA family protein [unclassified Undibacterium]MEB0140705.1 YqaA family protein [Undibacterium sp. CCC2.1]MEB0172322.1 YqaA family protein [Undibacterium sp. CCC1.1]MEB0176238.1 YqaA family protein [Undibacterium sp. CCC3.4]MEB0215522.1 YqaA family protein [Undibacterium sp. 5I2]WPX44332.1 YqaA family protein [Undibacterium sp. CCC3.4]
MIVAAINYLLGILALPQVGLVSVFCISLISATLLPMGSEPAVFAAIKANPAMFWPVLLVATVGNTLGGVIDYGMGYAAKQAFQRERESFWFRWLAHYGSKTMLLGWLPVIGDPLCTLAGWLKLPFWPCVMYMAIGKFLRYLSMTYLLLGIPDGFWHRLGEMLA